MEHDAVLAVAAILVVGVAAQWIGWRIRVPAIVFLLTAGLIAGPITGLLDPDEMVGDLLFPFVSLAVAVILFEGALGLGVSGVRAAGRTVLMLLTVGAAITMVLTAVTARELLDIPWSLAWVLSGVLVVTGPTVIGPLIRSIGLRGRVASILEAEGTLIDPLGAILTVLLFQAFYETEPGRSLPVELVITLGIGIVIGLASAGLLTLALARFVLPDELHNVGTLTMVVVAFAVADVMRPEAGLVAVTVMGFALASQRRVEVLHVLEFNETLRTLFISGLFILLGARIQADTLRTLEWRNIAFLAVLVVAVRPIATLVSTLGAGLGRRDRLFIAATAPRGIVAAAVASIFSLRLAEQGAEGSQVLVSATFTVIFGTVMLSGLGARPLARRLGMSGDERSPVVVLGTNRVALGFAEVLEKHNAPVRLISLDRKEVGAARLSGHAALHGSVLDDGLWEEVRESGATTFAALTNSDEVNVLAVSPSGRAGRASQRLPGRPGSKGALPAPRLLGQRRPQDVRGRDLLDPGGEARGRLEVPRDAADRVLRRRRVPRRRAPTRSWSPPCAPMTSTWPMPTALWPCGPATSSSRSPPGMPTSRASPTSPRGPLHRPTSVGCPDDARRAGQDQPSARNTESEPRPTTRVQRRVPRSPCHCEREEPRRKLRLQQVEGSIGPDEGREHERCQRGGGDLSQHPPHTWRHVSQSVSRRHERRTHREGAHPGQEDRSPRGAHPPVPPATPSSLSIAAPATIPLNAPTMIDSGPTPSSSAATVTVPPTAAARTDGRLVRTGTSNTRNTSGTANSSGTESGNDAPINAPVRVLSCHAHHRVSPAPV